MAPRVPADPGGGKDAEDADEWNEVLVRAGGCIAGDQIESEITTKPHPGEEEDEAEGQDGRAAAVGLLLGEEVGIVAHAPRLFIERSTVGTARSAESSISQSSAGDALASPATRLVGNCICFVLYCVATSL